MAHVATLANPESRQAVNLKIPASQARHPRTELTAMGTLARSRAPSGEPALIGGYLGQGDTFDKAIAAFSIAYSDQTERDYELLKKAARKGELEVVMER